MRVKFTDLPPDFVALCIEEDEGGGEFKIVERGKFHACGFLNVQADEVNAFADADFTVQFLFELVNDGL